MLSQVAIENACNIAKLLQDNNVSLTVKPGTLLGELTRVVNSRLYNIENDYNGSMVDNIKQASEGTNNYTNKDQPVYVLSDHDALMDNYIEDLSTIASNHVNFARGVVNKKVEEYSVMLGSMLDGFKPQQPEEFFNISYYELPEIFSSDYVLSDINNNSNLVKYVDDLPMSKINTQDFNLKEYLKTGDDDTDSMVGSYIDTLGLERATGFITNKISSHLLDVPCLIEYSAVNYLFYRTLATKLDINFGLTAMVLKTKAYTNMCYYSNALKTALSMYQSAIRNSYLLASDNKVRFSYHANTKYDIVIYSKSFEKLAETKTPIEALFGLLASGNLEDNSPVITTDHVINKSEAYVSRWENVRSLYLINHNRNRLSYFKQMAKNAYDVVSESVDDGEAISNREGHLRQCKIEVDKYFDEIDVADIDKLDKIALDVIAKIRFSYSNAYELLSEMSKILAMDEKITPSEASLYSNIKYLTDFLLCQSTTN